MTTKTTSENIRTRYATGERVFSGADLRFADFSGADFGEITTQQHALRRLVHEQISKHPETHEQHSWHASCGTAHCVAGWTIVFSGLAGELLERLLSTATAAHLLLGGKTRPSFAPYASRDDILRDLLP